MNSEADYGFGGAGNGVSAAGYGPSGGFNVPGGSTMMGPQFGQGQAPAYLPVSGAAAFLA